MDTINAIRLSPVCSNDNLKPEEQEKSLERADVETLKLKDNQNEGVGSDEPTENKIPLWEQVAEAMDLATKLSFWPRQLMKLEATMKKEEQRATQLAMALLVGDDDFGDFDDSIDNDIEEIETLKLLPFLHEIVEEAISAEVAKQEAKCLGRHPTVSRTFLEGSL